MNNYKSLSELELLGLIAQRDSKALEALYDSFSPILYTLTREIIEDAKTAENTLADIFSIIWRRSRDFRLTSGGAYCWIVQLARNKAVDVRRRKSHSEAAYAKYTLDYENQYILPVVPAELNSRISIGDVKNLSHRFAFSISELTDAQKYVIRLAFYDGLTQGEISSKLNIPLQTVKSKIQTALLNLVSTLNLNGSHEEFNWKLDETHYALAAGCLEKEDYINAKKSLSDSANLLQEYAELQKIISFLPVNIDPVSISPKLKNLVALKLIKYQKETEKKPVEQIKPAFPSEIIPVSSVMQEPVVQELRIKTKKPVEFVKIEEKQTGIPQNSEYEQNPSSQETDYQYPPERRKSWKVYPIIVTIVSVILAVALVLFYFKYKDQTARLLRKYKTVNSQLQSKEHEIKYLQKYQKIIDLLTAEKTSVTNIGGTKDNPEGFGKIIFFKNFKDGLLQLYNMHISPKVPGYRLWAVSGDKYYSIGFFSPEKEIEYYLIESISAEDLNRFESFILTEETGTTLNATPSDKIMLSGKPGK